MSLKVLVTRQFSWQRSKRFCESVPLNAPAVTDNRWREARYLSRSRHVVRLDPEAFGQDERAEKVVGSNQASATKDVGQEVRMHIDRRHPGNLRSHVFEHSSHCSAVIETSEPGGPRDTGPSV
jgi:hypothetical protein